MRRPIATVSLSGTLEEQLVATAQVGFDGIDPSGGGLVRCLSSPADIRPRVTELGTDRTHGVRTVGVMSGGIGPLLRRPVSVSSHACARIPTLRLSTNRPRASGAGKPSSP